MKSLSPRRLPALLSVLALAATGVLAVAPTTTAAAAPEAAPVVVAADPAPAPSKAPDADSALPASISEAQHLAANTATDNYRIPAITTAPNGDLLVAYDERPKDNGNKGGDSPNPNSIVQRRSTDNGKTWSEPTYIHQGTETGDKVGFSDPSYVVDYETGRIFNFHVKSFDQGFINSQAGTDPENRNVIQAEVSTSTDNGETWTHRVITKDITNDASWVSRFAASGQGIQIRQGDYAGRLVQQFTIRESGGAFRAVSVYSDDHGATWKAGQAVGVGMDENKVVELSDGTLMMNSRVSDGSGYRKVATSSDGGQTWSEPESDKNLPDSVDNAQIIRAFPGAAPDDPRAKILLLSHSPNPRAWSRNQGTVSMSCDDGASWQGANIFNQDFVGYTTLAIQSDGSIGLLSEDGTAQNPQYGGIWYRNLTLSWVGEQCIHPEATATTDSPTVAPGSDATVTVTVTNPTSKDLTNVAVPAPSVEGVTITAKGDAATTVKPGESVDYTFTVSTTGEQPGAKDLTFTVTWDGGTTDASVSLEVTAGAGPAPEPQPEPPAPPSDPTTAPAPTDAGQATGDPGVVATASSAGDGRGALSRTGANALVPLGIAAVALTGGYLALRARRARRAQR